MNVVRGTFIWAGLGVVVTLPIAAAAMSPLLAWRQPVYIAAGFAGIVAMALMVLQPLMVSGTLPGFPAVRGRRVHLWIGSVLAMSIVMHVVGLWITSPPDVIDALLFVSPTPFSAWGVIAMWAIFAAALLAFTRRRLRLRHLTWRRGHTALVTIAVVGSVVHAMLIEGTMETVTKTALCVLVIAATARTVIAHQIWKT